MGFFCVCTFELHSKAKGKTEMKSSYFYFSSNYTQKKIRYQYLSMKARGGRHKKRWELN